MTFIPLKGYEGKYEILNIYPYCIKKVENNKILNIYVSNGFYSVCLNITTHLHVLIGRQFLENPNKYNNIGFINGDATDFHLENLKYYSKTPKIIKRPSLLEFIENDEIADELNKLSDASLKLKYLKTKMKSLVYDLLEREGLNINELKSEIKTYDYDNKIMYVSN